MRHIPVLLEEVVGLLEPKPNQNFIDCTINGGGHSIEILKRTEPNGKILGIDLDQQAINGLNSQLPISPAVAGSPHGDDNYQKRLILINDNFVNLKNIVKENNFGPVAGILIDLGMSSNQIEESGRGFSFMRNEFLDMRFSLRNYPPRLGEAGESDTNIRITAAEIINGWKQEELERIFREYGEERFGRQIARKIVEERRKYKIETTFQLVEIIRQAIPSRYRHGRIHMATRVFQALRIAVNGELDNLKNVLPQMLEILEVGGRGAIISFHSLEDRIVKNFIRDEFKKEAVKILTKKPIVASQEEINKNPRARSAKLRVFEKI